MCRFHHSPSGFPLVYLMCSASFVPWMSTGTGRVTTASRGCVPAERLRLAQPWQETRGDKTWTQGRATGPCRLFAAAPVFEAPSSLLQLPPCCLCCPALFPQKALKKNNQDQSPRQHTNIPIGMSERTAQNWGPERVSRKQWGSTCWSGDQKMRRCGEAEG